MLSVNAVMSCAILNQTFFLQKSSLHDINLDVAMFAANVWWEKWPCSLTISINKQKQDLPSNHDINHLCKIAEPFFALLIFS